MIKEGPWRNLKRQILSQGFKNDHAYMCRNEEDPRFGLWFKHKDGRRAVIRHNSLTIFEKDKPDEAEALSTGCAGAHVREFT